jgi:signal-transduction protein with cAMP-binding, CBS, and nucleotidyltransferase domain
LPEVGTLERIRRLQELGVVQEEAAREMGDILNHLWQLRFYNQLLTDEGLPSINDEVDIEQLTKMERQALQSVLSSLSSLQTKLSYDFLGTIAY